MSFFSRSLLIAALTLACVPFSATADAGSANACRATLPEVGQKMFDAVAPHVRAGSDLAALMRTHVRPLVMGGAIARADAQANAHAVGACLKLLHD
ncbi:MAG: hypothetical protein KGS44_09890 [Alphaproteobacteria bacterium]|nr:hypothetical protein [Alphaproteobacteria bacterium]